MNILIAEDEPGTTEVYKLFIEGDGHRVFPTSNGQQCLDVYSRNVKAVDIVILDYRMPVKDGGIVLREMLKINPNQKVIIATAYSKEVLHARNLNLNLIKVMQKPFDPQDLLDTISDLELKPIMSDRKIEGLI